MSIKSIERYAGLLRCDSVSAWRDQLFKLGNELGYDKALLAILPDPKAPAEPEYAFLHSNYSDQWLFKYTNKKMHHFDPTFRHCESKSLPLVWTPDIFSTRRQKEMYEEACCHGLRSGISLPIHGPRGEMGILCFVNDARPGRYFQRQVRDMLPELSYFRDLVFETSFSFMARPQLPGQSPPITPKELECLKWCAAGKSSWDIAQILHCSEAAVNFHFSNLRRKFNVKSRQQVVVKALISGLIHLC